MYSPENEVIMSAASAAGVLGSDGHIEDRNEEGILPADPDHLGDYLLNQCNRIINTKRNLSAEALLKNVDFNKESIFISRAEDPLHNGNYAKAYDKLTQNYLVIFSKADEEKFKNKINDQINKGDLIPIRDLNDLNNYKQHWILWQHEGSLEKALAKAVIGYQRASYEDQKIPMLGVAKNIFNSLASFYNSGHHANVNILKSKVNKDKKNIENQQKDQKKNATTIKQDQSTVINDPETQDTGKKAKVDIPITESSLSLKEDEVLFVSFDPEFKKTLKPVNVYDDGLCCYKVKKTAFHEMQDKGFFKNKLLNLISDEADFERACAGVRAAKFNAQNNIHKEEQVKTAKKNVNHGRH